MKAVIYARYSSDNQREESIEGQIRECTAYAEKHDMTVLGTYIDRAFSAKTDNRPDFQRMIKESSKKLFDVVLVWKLDRFARNRYDSAHYKAILRKNGVKVVSAMESIAEDSTGILLESLLEGYAEFYSAELGEKVRRGQHENALKCKSNGGGIAYGYFINKDNQFEIDPLQAQVVQEVFTRYSEGESIKTIVNSLNERGLRNKFNNPFSKTMFTRLLRNRRYIGEYRFGDMVIENGIPPIIDNELFERVQKKLEKNKHAPGRTKTTAEEPYLLTTKIFCGSCGQSMAGESGKSQSGNIYYYYKCKSAKHKTGCKKKAVKKQFIEDLVVKRTIKLLLDDNMLDYLSEQAIALLKGENSTLAHLKTQLAETQKCIDNILNAIQQGIFTTSTKQRLEELEETKNKLETAILKEQFENPSFTKEQILCWLHRFRTLDISKPEHKQQLIDYFVNSVYVFDDKLVLTFNYKENTETIAFNNINGSNLETLAQPTKPQACLVVCFFSICQKASLWDAFYCVDYTNRKNYYNPNSAFISATTSRSSK